MVCAGPPVLDKDFLKSKMKIEETNMAKKKKKKKKGKRC